MRVLRLALVWSTLVFSLATTALAQGVDANVQLQLAEAQRHFDALDYEQTVPPLDRVINMLQNRQGDDVRTVLTDALAMRGRSHFGMNNVDAARRDFAALLRIRPSYDLGSQVSPRVTLLFEDVKRETVGTVRFSVTPPTATLRVDGDEVPPDTDVAVTIGGHTVTASQPGYRPETRRITIVAGTNDLPGLTLTRTAALMTFVTSPDAVDIVVDGRSRGKTLARPLPNDVAARVAEAGMDRSAPIGWLTVADMSAGPHRIEFRRGCFTSVEVQEDVAGLDDYILNPVTLTAATATVTVAAGALEPAVMIDGEHRGRAPFSGSLCEGTHVVELRGPTGRFVQKIDVKANQPITLTGTLRPAFALVASTQTSLNADLRGAIERAFAPARSILIFAPPAEEFDGALRAESLPRDWLGYDANRRPFGVSAEVTPVMRRDLSSKLAKTFDAQGIAAVTAPITANRTRLVLSILSAGMADPDVVEIDLDQPETVARALAQIDGPLSFFTQSIGLSAVDIVDGAGPVIASVDASGPAAQADLQPGDTVLTVDGKSVADSASLSAVIEAHAPADRMSLSLRDRTGAEKTADVAVVRRPRLLGVSDQTLMINRTLAVLRALLAASTSDEEQAVIRLNLAAALTRLEAWSEARTELQRVTIPDGPGVGSGTVQYLLGLCDMRLGDKAGASAAFMKAAASSSLLTEDGPPVRDLADARLAELSASASLR